MGEHDTHHDDGTDIDVGIERHENHPQYDRTFKIHDISVVTMQLDVVFTGKLNHSFPWNVVLISEYFDFHFAERSYSTNMFAD